MMMVQTVEDEEDEGEMEPVRPSEEVPDLHAHLSDHQQQQKGEVPQFFLSLFQERPGLTKAITHNIILKDPSPIRQRPYQVPEKMAERLKAEV